MTSTSNDRLLTVRETASTFGCSVATIWRHVSDQKLPKPLKIGGMSRWSESEVQDFITQAKSQREAA